MTVRLNLSPEQRTGSFSRRLVLAMQLGAPMPAKRLAERSGYSVGYIQSLMSGRRGQDPTLGCCKALADVLNVEPAWLAGWVGRDDGKEEHDNKHGNLYSEKGTKTCAGSQT